MNHDFETTGTMFELNGKFDSISFIDYIKTSLVFRENLNIMKPSDGIYNGVIICCDYRVFVDDNPSNMHLLYKSKTEIKITPALPMMTQSALLDLVKHHELQVNESLLHLNIKEIVHDVNDNLEEIVELLFREEFAELQ